MIVVVIVVLGLAADRVRPAEPARRRCGARRPSTTTGTRPTASTSATAGSIRLHGHPRGSGHRRLPRSTSAHAASTATTTASSTGTRSPRPPARNAKLGVFLDIYGVTLNNDKLDLPGGPARRRAYQADGTFERARRADRREEKNVVTEGDRVETTSTDTDDGTTYITDFDNIRDRPGRHGVLDRRSSPTAPRSGCRRTAQDLPQLGAADTGGSVPTDSDHPRSAAAPSATVRRSDRRPAATGDHGRRRDRHHRRRHARPRSRRTERRRPRPRATTTAADARRRARRRLRHPAAAADLHVAQTDAARRPRPIIEPPHRPPRPRRRHRGRARARVQTRAVHRARSPTGECAGVAAALRRRARAARHRRGDRASPPSGRHRRHVRRGQR